MIKLQHLIPEYVKGEPILFVHDTAGHYKGVDFNVLHAKDKSGNEIGMVVYFIQSVGNVHVDSIKTEETERRQGIATAMVKELQKKYPNSKIIWGYISTKAGKVLYSKLKKLNIIETDKEDFLRHHYTGYISPSAYAKYEKEGGLSWLGNKNKYLKLIATQQHGPYTVEYRQTGEKNQYVTMDDKSDIIRDERGMALMMSDEEIKRRNLPVYDTLVVAFVGNKPVGFASNEFGAVGVWVEKPYQKLGIGSDLGVFHIQQRQHILKGTSKLGQMTDAGVALTKKIYDKMEKIHGKDWFERLKKEPLKENINSMSDITMNDIDKKLQNRYLNRNIASVLSTLEMFYYDKNPEHKKWVEDYIKLLNKIKNRILKITENLRVPYIQVSYIKDTLLNQEEFIKNEDSVFPFPLYVAASKDPMDTVGVLVDINGKVLEIHEGNDEATPETINMVNRLVYPQGKAVRVYGSHDSKLVERIAESGYLPTNLYISPNKEHAKSYLDLKGKRTTFTGIININSVNQESDLDWKTVELTKIEKFRYI